MNNKYSDIEFMNSLRKGDEKAYKYLYKSFYSELCSYVASLCSDNNLAEDIVQQVMIKLWKKRNKLVIKHSLRKYLYKAVYHEYIDTQRKIVRKLDHLEQLKREVSLEFIDIPEEDIEKKLHLLEIEITLLPKSCKRVFVLAKKQGLKYSQIAIKLNISIKTVEAHMTLAHKRLRKKLINTFHFFFLQF